MIGKAFSWSLRSYDIPIKTNNFIYDNSSALTGLVYNGSSFRAITFLVYKQCFRINMTEGQTHPYGEFWKWVDMCIRRRVAEELALQGCGSGISLPNTSQEYSCLKCPLTEKWVSIPIFPRPLHVPHGISVESRVFSKGCNNVQLDLHRKPSTPGDD